MWTIGCDPGLTETGMVLLSPEGHYLSGVTFRAAKEGQDLERIVNLADSIVGVVKSWVHEHSIKEVLIGVEYPILRGGTPSYNVEAYRKQVNLLHEIETALWRWNSTWPPFSQPHTTPAVQVRVTEINPTASKRAATGSGSATKDDMILASPFERRDEIKRPTREALADAWAHAVAARLYAGADRLIDLEELALRRLQPQFVDTKTFKVEVK